MCISLRDGLLMGALWAPVRSMVVVDELGLLHSVNDHIGH